MSCLLDILKVDATAIPKVDAGSDANLYRIWTVFSRYANSINQGLRLENLSRRVWQLQPQPTVDTTSKFTVSSTLRNGPSDTRLPALSGSVETIADEDSIDFTNVSAPLGIRPRIRCLESPTSRCDRYISTDDFEKFVISILMKKAPLSTPSQPSRHSPINSQDEKKLLQRFGSTTTTSQPSELRSKESQQTPEIITTSIPSEGPVSEAISGLPPSASIDSSLPAPGSSPALKHSQRRNQPAQFSLSRSFSCNSFGQSLEADKPILSSKKHRFQIGGSSEEESSMSNNLALPTTAQLNTEGIESESAIGYTKSKDIDDSDWENESAIDDWEDDIDRENPSVDKNYFQRVEPKANPTSCQSLITLILTQNERFKTPGNQASQSTSVIPRPCYALNGSSLGVSPDGFGEGPRQTLKPIIEIPRSNAKPITTAKNHVHAQAALSPRTTRRNMLATELTESLRRHILWERQQKSSTANAVLKRRHTAHDVANLKQYPERPCIKQQDFIASSHNQYWNEVASNGYHSKGW